jgi:hypothetical protein
MSDNANRPAWFPFADALHRAVVVWRNRPDRPSRGKAIFEIEPYDDEDGNFLAMGFAGEAGEVANEFKKWMRGDYSRTEFLAKVSAELADARCMIELVARAVGVDLDEVTPRKLEDFEQKMIARGWITGPVAVRPPPADAAAPPRAELTTVTCRPCGGTGTVKNQAEWSHETCAACQGKGNVSAVIVDGRTYVAGG